MATVLPDMPSIHTNLATGLLQVPGPYVHAQTSFTGAICAPYSLFQTIWSCQVRREKYSFIDCLRRSFHTVHAVSLRQRVRGSVVARAIRFRPPTRDLSWEHCCYAPCRDDRSLRHPEEHKVPERLRALTTSVYPRHLPLQN